MPRQEPPSGEERLKYITTKEAMEIVHKAGIVGTKGNSISISTFLRWVVDNELGFQPGGNDCQWYINRQKLEEWLNGKNCAA